MRTNTANKVILSVSALFMIASASRLARADEAPPQLPAPSAAAAAAAEETPSDAAEASPPSAPPPVIVVTPAAPRGGRLQLKTADGRGFIVIDGKVMAEGALDEVVPAGDHRIAFVRDGYQRVEMMKHIEEGSSSSEIVTLVANPPPPPVAAPAPAPAPAPVTAPLPSYAAQPPSYAAAPLPASHHAAPAPRLTKADADRAEETSTEDSTGMVGTLSFATAMQLGSSGSESERSCESVGSQCAASPSTGGGFSFSVGHMWKYLGFDVLAGASLDGGERRFVDQGGAAKSYTVERLGGMAAVRLRGQIESKNFRGALALGPGVVYRVVGKAESFPSIPEDAKTYNSLAFTADISGQWRVGSSTALAIGAMLWLENAGNDVTTNTRGGQNDFALVSGAQASVMPYIGFQFGK